MFNQGTQQDQRPAGDRIVVSYTESSGLLWLSIKNFLLTLVTLTIYRFWGKTHVRRHIWSNVAINGEALEYTGTGKELFFGFLLVFGLFFMPVIAILTTLQLVYGPESAITLSANLLLYLIIFMLWGMAVYRARRYRLSRTLWRGVRGSLSGSPMSFSMLFFGAMLLRGLTLGWSTPAMNLNIQERMIGDMSFGNRSFLFAGPAGPLYKRFALCWFLTPVVLALAVVLVTVIFTGTTSFSFEELGALFEGWTEQMENDSPSDSKNAWTPIVAIFMFFFGIYVAYAVLWTFYIAREMVVFASYTTFDKAGFRLDATVGSLIGLWLGNLAIMIFTLGIGQPYVLQRLVRYLCDRLSVEGTVNLAAISQSTATMDKRGEGLVEAFDIDAF